MHAMAARHHRRVFVLDRAALQRGEHRVEIGKQDVGRLRQLHRQAGVELDAEIILRLPDRRHLRPAVARDHAETSSAEISLFGAQDAAAAESTMKDSAISTSSWYSP